MNIGNGAETRKADLVDAIGNLVEQYDRIRHATFATLIDPVFFLKSERSGTQV